MTKQCCDLLQVPFCRSEFDEQTQKLESQTAFASAQMSERSQRPSNGTFATKIRENSKCKLWRCVKKLISKWELTTNAIDEEEAIATITKHVHTDAVRKVAVGNWTAKRSLSARLLWKPRHNTNSKSSQIQGSDVIRTAGALEFEVSGNASTKTESRVTEREAWHTSSVAATWRSDCSPQHWVTQYKLYYTPVCTHEIHVQDSIRHTLKKYYDNLK